MTALTLETLTEIERIRRTIIRYAHLLDDGDFGGWGALFTDDAEFCSIPGDHLPGGHAVARIVGRAAIVDTVAAAQRDLRRTGDVLHFGAAPLVDVDGAQARASWDFLIVHGSAGDRRVAFAGRYEATLVRQDGEWRFSRRTSRAAGVQRSV